MRVVQELEMRLQISERWTSESPEWGAAVKDIHERQYQKALDALEFLVVQRIFELTKANQSETGQLCASCPLYCTESILRLQNAAPY